MKLLRTSFIGVCVEKQESDQNNKPLNNTKTSIDLAHKITNGDKYARSNFFSVNYKWLLFIVRRKFTQSNNHEDIVQDALMLVIRKLQNGEVKKPQSIMSFLRTTAINIGFEYHRQDKRFKSSMDQDLLDEIENTKEDILATIIWHDKTSYVKQVISELSIQRDREILYKFYFQEQGKPSICEQLNLSSEHFDRVLYRAKQRLKQLIEHKADNDSNNNTMTKIKTPKKAKNDDASTFIRKVIATVHKTILFLCRQEASIVNFVKIPIGVQK